MTKDDFVKQVGVTLDPDYEIQSVTAPPTAPATPALTYSRTTQAAIVAELRALIPPISPIFERVEWVYSRIRTRIAELDQG